MQFEQPVPTAQFQEERQPLDQFGLTLRMRRQHRNVLIRIFFTGPGVG
jgi:hypothetical protein